MKLPINTQWLIVTMKEPVMFHQTADETWLLNPNRRYILNANRLAPIEEFIKTISEFDSSSLYSRLIAGKSLANTNILIERNRERGIGDLLFLTGPLAYFQHVSGGRCEVDVMAFADRGVVMTHSPLINNGNVKCGALEYDSLRNYNHHWFVNTVTEQDSESDQLNVYDALFKQLGFDPVDIEPQWKRPSAQLINEDFQHLDIRFKRVWDDRKVDLRRIGYYVVAPFANGTIRCMRYGRWLDTIKMLATRRPVFVVGTSTLRLPDTDMSAGLFIERLSTMGSGVINGIDSTSLRVLMALIGRATCVIGPDSGPLYIAQALRTPAVSVWGTHSPAARLGYDKSYMDLAIWNNDACAHCPCFAYARFPYERCPKGQHQEICEVLDSISPEDVLKRVDTVENITPVTP